LQAPSSDLSEREKLRLQDALAHMPEKMLYELADKYDLNIDFDALDNYSMAESLLSQLSVEMKKEILTKYGDAGKVSTFILCSRGMNPELNRVKPQALDLLKVNPSMGSLEKYPYFDEVEVDNEARLLKIRFHYLLGAHTFYDELTGKPKIQRHFWRGVIVYRPNSRFLEIRTKHGSISRLLAVRVPVQLGLAPHYPIDLMEPKVNKKFVEWISSLNSATIQLPLSEVSGSLIISARKGMDLRTAKRYNEELKYGRLKHGHVTIKRSDEEIINFHIYFRTCHIIYTLLTSEEDIDFILQALEKISEGSVFDRPERLLVDFFNKEA
jgi:hypothetical protein